MPVLGFKVFGGGAGFPWLFLVLEAIVKEDTRSAIMVAEETVTGQGGGHIARQGGGI